MFQMKMCQMRSNIVLLEPGTFGKKVPYQCLHCRSKRWPEGRVGDCSRYHAKSIRHFLVQHIGSGMHYRAVVFNQPQQLVPHVPCEGLCVNVKETAGILYEHRHIRTSSQASQSRAQQKPRRPLRGS